VRYVRGLQPVEAAGGLAERCIRSRAPHWRDPRDQAVGRERRGDALDGLVEGDSTARVIA
jgi:hypothetical protein